MGGVGHAGESAASATPCRPPGGCAESKKNYYTEMCSVSQEGLYPRPEDFVSLNSRLESDKEEEGARKRLR